jgi:hypothetical protein
MIGMVVPVVEVEPTKVVEEARALLTLDVVIATLPAQLGKSSRIPRRAIIRSVLFTSSTSHVRFPQGEREHELQFLGVHPGYS